MKNQVTRKVVLVCSAVLLGIAVCMSVWFLLQNHKAQVLQGNSTPIAHNNRRVAQSRNALQPSKNTDENHRREHIALEERIVQTAKNNFMSMLSEEELARPDIQKRIAGYDSPQYRELVKEVLENGPISKRKLGDVLESQGIPVDREVFAKLFHKVFPTGEPEDYEPEMRLEMAKLFLAAEPVDLTDSIAAHNHRVEVYSKFMRQSRQNLAWLAGFFDADWNGVHRTTSNPALDWITDVQRNAVGIVAGAEATGASVTDTDTPASSWDLSSVMESPSEFSDATTGESQSIFPPVPDGLAHPAISKPETDTAVAPGLTDAPKTPTNLPTIEGFEASLKEQFSSERFERAMSTLDRYGPEEGLRRLKENDPEVAKRIEQHRNRSRSGDSDKSEEEASQ